MSARARKSHAPIFAALGDETRLSLVSKLCDYSPRSITELSENSKLSRQAITKHLQILENVGLVRSVREGRQSLYEFNADPIDEMKEYLNEISKQWDQVLSRLKTFVED